MASILAHAIDRRKYPRAEGQVPQHLPPRAPTVAPAPHQQM